MNTRTSKVFIVALGLIVLCALFPPRRKLQGGDSAGRGFLFSPNLTRSNLKHNPDGGTSWIPVVVDGSRFAVECVFILSLSGLVALALNSKQSEQ